MTWRRLSLCFELLSPLHIGFLPNRSGTVMARTRCYVPGKNLWGAVTESLVSRLHSNPTPANFHEVGESMREQITFSYFYLSDGAQLFAPDYTTSGMAWANLTDRAFRARFIGSQVSTAIGETGGAQDAGLHEIEFIRHRVGSPEHTAKRVLLMGVVWVRAGAAIAAQRLDLHDGSVLLDGADIFQAVVLGGERNYGFGRLSRVLAPVSCVGAANDLWPDDPETVMPVNGKRALISHAPYRQDLIFKGDIEIVAGREYQANSGAAAFRGPGQRTSIAGYCFAPGTRLNGKSVGARIDSWGRVMWVHDV